MWIQKLWYKSPHEIVQFILKKRKKKQESEIKKITIREGYAQDLKLTLNTTDDNFKTIQEGNYENVLFEYLSSQNLNDSVFWDIGAHFGYISLVMAKMITGTEGKIIAFEPNPLNVDAFQENISNNANFSNKIELYPLAISNQNTEILFRTSPKKNHPHSMGGHLINSKTPFAELEYQKLGFQEILVQTTTIDDFLLQNQAKKPHIIKIDVEGAELDVLKGGLKTLKTIKPLLIIEIHHIILMFHIQNFLKDLGYQLTILDEQNAIASVCILIAQ